MYTHLSEIVACWTMWTTTLACICPSNNLICRLFYSYLPIFMLYDRICLYDNFSQIIWSVKLSMAFFLIYNQLNFVAPDKWTFINTQYCCNVCWTRQSNTHWWAYDNRIALFTRTRQLYNKRKSTVTTVHNECQTRYDNRSGYLSIR